MARSSPYRVLPETLGKMFGQKGELVDDAASRNLVGEYARPAEKPRRGRVCLWLAVAAASGLAALLLALALVREVQLAAVRRELGALRRDVDALQLRVEAIHKRAEEGRNMIDELAAFEDGPYAGVESGADGEPAADLDSITVLQDDEDMYEDDDEEGSSYQDYDNRQKATGEAQAPPTPEDFLGVVLSARPPDAPMRASKISELHRMLHAAPAPHPPPAEATRERRSVRAASPAEEIDAFAAPRVYSAKSEDRRKSLKYERDFLLSNSIGSELRPPVAPLPASPVAPLPASLVARHTRNSDDQVEEEARRAPAPRRPFVAAHFHGNTSHLSPLTHEHYMGNGLLRLPHDAPHSVWSPAEWTRRAPHPAPRLTRAGHVHVRHTGIYFVYVQIYYLDEHDTAGWVLHRTSPEQEEREPLLQCAAASPSVEYRDKPNSCYSAAALLLRAGDRLAVRNTGGDRHSIMQPEKSFIGLVKLADLDYDEE